VTEREKAKIVSEGLIQELVRNAARYVGSDDADYAHNVMEDIIRSAYTHGFDDGFAEGVPRLAQLEQDIVDSRTRIEKLEKLELTNRTKTYWSARG